MLYWNGSAWTEIPAPTVTPGQNLTLHLCANGVPNWICPVSYNVGATGPAGGIVFSISNYGINGLEAAPTDLANNPTDGWGCVGTSIATSTAVGTGAANTQAIIANCQTSNTAASLAAGYSLNGFSDWYLPSNAELVLLYHTSTLDGGPVGGFASTQYWSSSQSDTTYAWYFAFGTGQNYSNATKSDSSLKVRPIRSF